MFKAVIFDMDGVIVDSESGFLRAKQQLLEELGVHVDVSYHYHFFGTTAEYTWTTAKEAFDLEPTVPKLIQRADELRQTILQNEGLKPIRGALDLIAQLHQAGVVLAVASSSPMHEIRANLTNLGCLKYFTALASAGECERSKPFPDVFLKAAALIDIAPHDCLVIEDSTNGTKAAKAAGMTCLGYINPDYPPQDMTSADTTTQNLSESAAWCLERA
ncbi:MAG: HAD family phosphatase [Eubacteriales bacterium]|nr:HAD family phosphatase [Eubacteriales bacterium]